MLRDTANNNNNNKSNCNKLIIVMIPQQTRGLLPNVGPTLAHRLQRRPGIGPMTVFAGDTEY